MKASAIWSCLDVFPGSSQIAIHLTHKLVGVALASDLLQDVLQVVVTKTTRQFLVVHSRLALSLAPLLGHLMRTANLELPW